ncbi:conserved protein, unknown function [Hepatocystis sp. ex Piliocolobus tephrosceles]|nr:conserved protein, unknown function [Hepatocystis sp. ex Piliocolobus tephrosceles]
MAKNICLIGGDVGSLFLGHYLRQHKLNVKLLSIKKKCNFINTQYNKSNIFECGYYHSFILNSSQSSYLSSLLRELKLEGEIIESNKYSSNISFLNCDGRIYKINKYIPQICYFIFKDYFFHKFVNVKKNERLKEFVLKYCNKKIYEDLITPYCYHHFGYSPEHILMKSYFPNFLQRLENEKSLFKSIKCLNGDNNKNSNLFQKNKKVVRFKEGNVLLTNKLIDHFDLYPNTQHFRNIQNLKIICRKGKVKVSIGRNVIRCDDVVLCLNPLELKNMLKKKKFQIENKKVLIKHLNSFRCKRIKITNVCYKKNVLPLSQSLESLMLVKQNEKNKIISLLYDHNIFSQMGLNSSTEKTSTHEILYETRLRFMSSETKDEKCVEEINTFLQDILKLKEGPDLVIGDTYNVFLFNERLDKAFKKLINKKYKQLKIFWIFFFFKNLEFCLRETKNFCNNYYS